MEHRVKKCEICGSTADVQVIASHFGSYSYASCSHCAYLGLEPYSNVVAFKFTVGIDTPIQDEYEKQIDAILNFFIRREKIQLMMWRKKKKNFYNGAKKILNQRSFISFGYFIMF